MGVVAAVSEIVSAIGWLKPDALVVISEQLPLAAPVPVVFECDILCAIPSHALWISLKQQR